MILVKTLNKKSILVKIFENLNFDQVIENFDFSQNFSKIMTIVKIMKKISPDDKIFGKSQFWSKFSESLDFFYRNFEKIVTSLKIF